MRHAALIAIQIPTCVAALVCPAAPAAETLTVPPCGATPASTANGYAGLVGITLSGTMAGVSGSGTRDPFYALDPLDDSVALGPDPQWLRYNRVSEGPCLCGIECPSTSHPVPELLTVEGYPSFESSHTYGVVLFLGDAPAEPLHFGVADCGCDGTSGGFVVTIESATTTTSTTLPAIDCDREIAAEYAAVDVTSLIRVRTTTDVDRVRADLIQYIWKAPQLPATLPDEVATGVPNPLPDFTPPPGTRVTELTTVIGAYVARSYLFTPPHARRRLVIVHQGHSGLFGSGRVAETARALLDQRYSVVAVFMPLFGPNEGPFSPWPFLHDPMLFEETPTFSPISIFLEPVVRIVNYATTHLRIRRIAMLGLSGGGWTTTLTAAVDPRIRTSVAVAGSLPLYLRTPPCLTAGSWGDYEQRAGFTTIADYLDLFVLGSVGRGRAHLQVLNQFDPCCFNGIAYQTYEAPLVEAVTALRGRYGVFLDSSHDLHQISPVALADAIGPFLMRRRLPR